MIIKKFQGKTENEAVEAAKRELGKNIVIMNVKGVKKKGFFRFFRSDMVEVTIALEEENERYYPLRKEEKRNRQVHRRWFIRLHITRFKIPDLSLSKILMRKKRKHFAGGEAG